MRKTLLVRIFLVLFFLGSGSTLSAQAVVVETGQVLNNERKAQQEVRLTPANGVATATGALQSRLYIDKTIIEPNSYGPLSNNTGLIRTHDKNLPVGTIDGDAFVDLNGTANYSIKIDVPPGTKGISPDLSINYNHHGGDEQLGLGWSIGGVSRIKKQNYTMFQDEQCSVYNNTYPTWAQYSSNWTVPVYLDGVKLIPLSDPTTTNMFRLQDDNQSRVIYDATNDYFLLETAGGKKMEYGRNSSSNNSILKINNTSDEWYLTKVYDNYGNYMEYFYYNINNEIAIKEIKYTGNSNTSQAPYNSVKFYYNKRNDEKFKYYMNDSLKYALQLREIETFCEGMSVFRYEFKYSFETFSYLDEIIKFSGPSNHFNSTAFVYGGTPRSLTDISLANLLDGFKVNSPEQNYVTADFNNDGKTDILEMKILGGAAAIAPDNGFEVYDGFKLYLNNGNSNFQLAQTVDLEKGSYAAAFIGSYGFLFGVHPNPNAIETGDINGDGYIDLVYPIATDDINTSLVAYLFDPVSNQLVNANLDPSQYKFRTPGSPAPFTGALGNTSMMMGDFDGNGTSDIMTIFLDPQPYNGGNEAKFFDFSGLSYTHTMVTTFNNLVSVGSLTYTERLSAYKGFSALDYNNDGVTDIICYKDTALTDVAITAAGPNTIINTSPECRFVVLGKDKNTMNFYEMARFPIASNSYPADHASSGDFNGDGYTDFISHRFLASEQSCISYGTGSAFTFPMKNCNGVGRRGINKKFLALDINADAVSDLVKIEKSATGQVSVGVILGQNIATATAFEDYGIISPGLEGGTLTCTMPPIKDYFHPYCDYDYDGNPHDVSGCFNSNTDPDDVFDQDANEIPYFGTGDFDGDGFQDIIMRRQCPSGGPSFVIIYFKFKYQNKLLTSIYDGLNQVTTFGYATTANNSGNNYSKSGSVYSYPSPRVNFPYSIATSMTYKNPANLNGSVTNQVFNYSYEDLIVNKIGRGVLGFLKVKKTNGLTNMSEESSYIIDPTFIVKLPKQTKTISASLNTTLKTVTYDYTLSDLTQPDNITPGGARLRKRFYTQLNSETTTDHVRNITTVSSSTYDADNNVTQNITNVANGKQITTVDYSNFINAGSWINNKPTNITVTRSYLSQSPANVKTQDISYNTTLGHVEQTVYELNKPHAIKTEYVCDVNTGMPTQKNISAPNDPLAPAPYNTSYAYDSKSRFIVTENLPLGYSISKDYDFSLGLPVKITSVDNLVTKFDYDVFGRLKNATDPNGNQTTTNLQWYASSNQQSGDPNPVNDQVVLYYSETQPASGPLIRTYYDLAGRAVKEDVQGFNTNISSLTDFDILGNVKKQYGPYAVPPIVGKPYTTTAYSYSTDKNELTGIQTSDGTINNSATIAYAYNTGNGELTITNTAPDSKVTQQRIDATDKLTRYTDDGGTLVHTYNNAGQLITTTLNNDVVVTNSYDAGDFLHTESLQNSGTTTHNYNAYGQLKSMADAKATSFTYNYDQLGRMLVEGIGPDTYYYTYKNAGNGKGQMDNIIAGNNTQVTYSYDGFGRMTQLNEKINNVTYASKYEYDYLNRLTKKTYPNNLKLNYTYDNLSYPLKIENDANGQTLWQAVEMDHLGNYTKYIRGNGIQTTESYNSLGMPKTYTASGIQSLEFDFNTQNGNLKSIVDHLNSNIIEEYAYDNLDRLVQTKINQANPLAIAYDTRGNITSKFDGGALIPGTPKHDQVTNASNPNDEISVNGQSVIYTLFNKAQHITEGANEIEITYGPDKERMLSEFKQNGSTTLKRLYLNECEMDFDSYGTVLQTINYINAPNGLCAMQVTQGATANLYYPYFNHLGSILAVTNGQGAIVAQQNFDAWGRRRNPANWSYSSLNTLPSWLYRGFTGHEMLYQFDLVNMNGRMYDPKIGRMLTPDPILQPEFGTQAYNKYSYVFNNPLKYTDPSGYQSSKAHKTFSESTGGGKAMSAEEYSKQAFGGELWTHRFVNNNTTDWTENIITSVVSRKVWHEPSNKLRAKLGPEAPLAEGYFTTEMDVSLHYAGGNGGGGNGSGGNGGSSGNGGGSNFKANSQTVRLLDLNNGVGPIETGMQNATKDFFKSLVSVSTYRAAIANINYFLFDPKFDDGDHWVNAYHDIKNFVSNATLENWSYGITYAGLSFATTKGLGAVGSSVNGIFKVGGPIGPIKNWARIGNSFSQAGDFPTFGLRWGAGGKHWKKIGNPKFQKWNMSFRKTKLPFQGWRSADEGHFHFWKTTK